MAPLYGNNTAAPAQSFGAGVAPGLEAATRAIFMGPQVRQQAQLQSGLMGAQAAGAQSTADLNNYKLGQFQSPDVVAKLNAMVPGLGTVFSTGSDPNNLMDAGKAGQQVAFRGQVLNNIGDPGTDPAKINLGTSVLEGKTYEPFASVEDTGATLDKGTGAMATANPAMMAIFGNKAVADAQLKQAQADAAARSASGQHYDAARGVVVNTNTGTAVAPTMPGGAPLPPPTNQGGAIIGYNDDGSPIYSPGKLKTIPPQVMAKVQDNQTNMRKVQLALDAVKANPDALGLKNELPGGIVQRLPGDGFEGGVGTRAAVADLGSMIIHDRSGAAVTASEFPRLAPFIPLATDDAPTVTKKLQRFQAEYQAIQDGFSDMYGPQNGYQKIAVSSGGSGAAGHASPAAAAPSTMGMGVPQAAAVYLKSNPGLAVAFDKKYGAGAAARILNMGQ